MMKRALTALTVATTMFASGVSAFDADDLQTLLDTNECEFCDLSGAYLYEAELSDANLFNADLSGIELTGANLDGANLDGADLTGADLRGARLSGAILCNTIMPDGSAIYSGC